MTLKPFLIALGIGGAGVAGVLLTSPQKAPTTASAVFPAEEISIWQHIGVMAMDPQTNEVIAEYPSAYDASIITSIPQDQVINSMMSGETIQGVVFVLK